MPAHHKPNRDPITSTGQDSNRRLATSPFVVFPIAMGVTLLFSAWRTFVAVAIVSGMGWAWKLYQQRQQRRLTHLNVIFYQLVQEHNGRLTALDFAMHADISGAEAQNYLDDRAQEFSALFEVTEIGGVVYCFSSVKLPEGEPTLAQPKPPFPNPIEAKIARGSLSPPLNQSQLAERLQVHPTTVSKNKSKPDFSVWSRTKDPAGIAWTYAAGTKQFFPLDGDRQ